MPALDGGDLQQGLSLPQRNRRCRREALLVSARDRLLKNLCAPRHKRGAVSFSGVPSHAYVSGRMLFLSDWHRGSVQLEGGEGMPHIAGVGAASRGGERKGGCVRATLTMRLRAGWLSHPRPTLITSCLALPSSSDTCGHTPLLESSPRRLCRALLATLPMLDPCPQHGFLPPGSGLGWASGRHGTKAERIPWQAVQRKAEHAGPLRDAGGYVGGGTGGVTQNTPQLLLQLGFWGCKQQKLALANHVGAGGKGVPAGPELARVER